MLQPQLLSPDTATAALRRLKPTPEQLAEFRGHLAEMFRHLDPNKIERHGETHILDFLRSVSRPAEGGTRYGNVHGKRDLVLHLGDTADSPVGVVLEVKGPKNPKEMLAPDDLNRKALHQLLLYYLEDRTDDKADDFRRLIITTGYEWYVFDATDFNRLFWKDKAFVKDFRDWKAGAKASSDTDFFYKSIAGRKLAALDGELRVAYVDLRPGLPATPAALTALYRLFHPAYLLKEPLTGRRDPNTLNQEFYHELLYLMGLREDKQGGVRRIGRCPEGERQAGSLLENTLRKLETGHGLNYVPEADRLRYGDTAAAQREGVALALCLMWVNRLLFLKLLEGQLVRYHEAAHAAAFRFLHPARLSDYDEVLTLFFEVLNRAPADRAPDVAAQFPEVPYLNSFLFEPSDLEGQTFDISGLRDGLGLAPFPGSVLRKVGAPVVPPAKAHTSAAPPVGRAALSAALLRRLRLRHRPYHLPRRRPRCRAHGPAPALGGRAGPRVREDQRLQGRLVLHPRLRDDVHGPPDAKPGRGAPLRSGPAVRGAGRLRNAGGAARCRGPRQAAPAPPVCRPLQHSYRARPRRGLGPLPGECPQRAAGPQKPPGLIPGRRRGPAALHPGSGARRAGGHGCRRPARALPRGHLRRGHRPAHRRPRAHSLAAGLVPGKARPDGARPVRRRSEPQLGAHLPAAPLD
ncbi:DUF7149 domain-containing protein [Hymenobacter elongatus]|uniref:DUF7149 domain-containing protein n=1 Tax=Hymenobacter elongatus TaxID=877208 RepID=UPI001FD9A300|nr:hypothetical protein [Hymenobacter elongatus]